MLECITASDCRKDARVVFTDTQKWYASQAPFFPKKSGANQGLEVDKLTKTKPRLFAASLGKAPPKSAWQIPKMDTGPAPGSYDTATAIAKTQWRGIESTPKRTAKNLNFTAIYAKTYSANPSPCTYKILDNHATILNKDKTYANKARGLAI